MDGVTIWGTLTTFLTLVLGPLAVHLIWKSKKKSEVAAAKEDALVAYLKAENEEKKAAVLASEARSDMAMEVVSENTVAIRDNTSAFLELKKAIEAQTVSCKFDGA